MPGKEEREKAHADCTPADAVPSRGEEQEANDKGEERRDRQNDERYSRGIRRTFQKRKNRDLAERQGSTSSVLRNRREGEFHHSGGSPR